MTRKRRIATGALVVLILLAVGSVAAIAAAIVHAGMIEIEVQERDGVLIGVRIPAAFVQLAAGVALRFVPDRAFEECGDELGDCLPLVEALCGEIARCPDTEFVRVEGRGETVSVAKIGNRMVVDVEGRGERVHLAIPIGVVDQVVAGIRRAARARRPARILAGEFLGTRAGLPA